MKKSILTLAVLTATASQAQTEAPAPIEFYGRFDVSMQSISKADTNGKSVTAMTSGAIDTSILGLRGLKNLSNDNYVGFNVEMGVYPNNGTIGGKSTVGSNPSTQLFDRGAFVSLGNKKLGRLDVGYAPNPMINVTTVPLAGNSVNVATAYSMNWTEYYTRNSITYSTPNLSGFRGQLQYGAANTAGETSNGSVLAGIADYSTPKFGVSFAAQQRNAGNGSAGQLDAANTGSSSTVNAPKKSTYLAAARYNMGDWKFAVAYWNNKVNPDGALGAGSSVYSINATQVGFSYQINPLLVAGMSYTSNSAKSSLVNAQLRYELDKSTTLYTQINKVDNSSSTGRASGPYGGFYTVNAPGVTGLTPAGINNASASAIGVGVIYRF